MSLLSSNSRWKIKKIRIAFIFAITLLSICISGCSSTFLNPSPNLEEGKEVDIMILEIPDIAQSISENIFSNGCVRNEKEAEAIGKIILTSVYGENFDNGLPLLVMFDAEGQVWWVENQLPKDSLGGVHHIVIRKSNAEIIAIWATQ